MKLDRKGFTLIELLAVIVILAIIMLIATPTVLNLIEDARVGAAKNSAMGYIDALEKEVMARQLKDDTSLMNTTFTDPAGISIRGKAPDKITVNISNGMVIDGTIQFGDYVFTVKPDGTVSRS